MIINITEKITTLFQPVRDNFTIANTIEYMFTYSNGFYTIKNPVLTGFFIVRIAII